MAPKTVGETELGLLRQDNRFQVWQLMQSEPLLRYESKQGDNLGNVVGIHGVKSKKRDDVVMLNYTGWIFSLITDRSKVKPVSIEYFNKMKEENEEIKFNLEEKISNLENTTFIKPMDVKLKVDFIKMDAISYYKLIVECEIPIELLQIASDVVMNILDDENATSDVNQAVCSITEANPNYPLIITYRCQSNTQRLEINLRPVEGFSGELIVFVFPNLQSNKIAIRRVFEIKALSLYIRCPAFESTSSFSSIKIVGDFSSALIR